MMQACGTSGDLSLGRFPSESVAIGGSSFGGAGSSTGGIFLQGGAFGEGGALPSCSPGAALPAAVHRYDFSGLGTIVEDVTGESDGEILGGAMLDGSGAVTLAGDPEYVNLPDGILGSGDSVSILLWVRLLQGPAYWRIFDFGTSSNGEDPSEHSVGTYYVALTPETGFEPNGLALLIGRGGPSSEDRALTSIQIAERDVAIGVVLDGSDDRGSLFFNGQVVAETPLSGPLSDFDDVNNWLGKSQYTADPHVKGTYDEVRIYHRALSACEMSALMALGPDDPGTD